MGEAKMSANGVPEEFSSVFQGLGNMGEPYDIKLKPDANPYALFTPRNIPLPLRPNVEEELRRMEELGVISKVDVPTPWCAGMVVVPKKNGKVRICVDLQPLNRHVLREVHPLPKVDETLAQLSGAKVFSKLDANSGFWQIPLSEESKLLTTFITPQGRYCFNKLPFGICSAPEHFQKRMSQILVGLEGVLSSIDDVFVFGKDKKEHDTRLMAALRRILDAGVTLNREKCEFAKSRILFLGHIVDQNGIQADPERTKAIEEMSPPENISKLRRFLGMINQLGKFSCNLAELSQPLRELLKKDRTWVWGKAQEEAFLRVKEEFCKSTVLSLYNPNAATKISADASSYGLGAVLLQEHDSAWKPVAYASRSMTKTETRYAQVEKEALAITWACDKFANYIIGLKVLIETDHKPLIPLLGSKHLDDLPPRILRFRLRLARVDYSIEHVPGKLLYTADMLSRAPRLTTENDVELEEDTEHMMEVMVNHLPATEEKLGEYASAQASDPACSKILQYCQQGWPDKNKIEPHLKPYWKVQGELTISNNLLLYGRRIVVPKSLQRETLRKIHDGHQGIQRSQLRARCSIWWPGMGAQIKNFVESCPTCVRNYTPRHEPLMSTSLPDYPWQKVASDLFYLKGEHYMVVVDYFSRYPEVVKLKSTTSSTVIDALKGIFSRHGIPQTFVSDNGPQYASEEFSRFASGYNFLHVTSSPHYPQSNGCAERAVQTMKNVLKDSDDPYLAMLIYRSTPLPWCGLSPSELLMGRRLKGNLPQVVEHLQPQWPYLEDFRTQDSSFKRRQKDDYDRRHGVRSLPPIPDDSEVWITSDKKQAIPGRVTGQRGTPRSYNISTPSGQVSRNRHQLNVIPSPQPPSPPQSPTPPQPQAQQAQQRIPSAPCRIMTRSQTGTAIHPPKWPKTW
jgi:transposase InsO family protein